MTASPDLLAPARDQISPTQGTDGDAQVRDWLVRQLAVAPPLTPDQLCRLQVLLAADHAVAVKSV